MTLLFWPKIQTLMNALPTLHYVTKHVPTPLGVTSASVTQVFYWWIKGIVKVRF